MRLFFQRLSTGAILAQYSNVQQGGTLLSLSLSFNIALHLSLLLSFQFPISVCVISAVIKHTWRSLHWRPHARVTRNKKKLKDLTCTREGSPPLSSCERGVCLLLVILNHTQLIFFVIFNLCQMTYDDE